MDSTQDKRLQYTTAVSLRGPIVNMEDEKVVIRSVQRSDIVSVAQFAKQSFRDTFFESAGYDENQFRTFIEEEYSEKKLKDWINNPNQYGFVAAMKGSECLGFSLVGKKCKLPVETVKENVDCELYKCYVAKDQFGTGLATRLMNAALEWVTHNATVGDIYIGVWSENFRAQKFYSKFGAEKVGEYKYLVGDTQDHEFIYRIDRSIVAC